MQLRLYQPQYHELAFREQLLSDPATMSFNRGKDPGEDYHPETGCIDFPRSYWALWYNFWMEREPENFYAFLADGSTPLGEVSWFFDGESYRVGIILKKEFRGKGYCAPSLELLAEKAFGTYGLPALSVTVSTAFSAAVKGYLRAGFRRVRRSGGTCDLVLTREEWLQKKEN